METFDKKRLLSIIEYNLRKYRINGVQYSDSFSTDDPTGIKGLISNDNSLFAWSQKPEERSVGSNKRYILHQTNQQIRDCIANIVFDIFCGSDSNGNYSKSNNKLYNIKPSSGSSIKNKEEPFIIKRGNTEFKITEDGVFVNGKKI